MKKSQFYNLYLYYYENNYHVTRYELNLFPTESKHGIF